MNDLVINYNGTLATTQDKVSVLTDNNEQSVQRLIRTYKTDLKEFGELNFQNELIRNSKNKINYRKVYYLNEQQATLLLTYMKNTPKVREAKKILVRAFYDMRQKLQALKFEAYENEISSLKADAEIEAKKHGKKLAYYKGEITKAKNALASYRAKITSRSGFPPRINSTELSALNKELMDVKHEAISNMSEVFRLRGEIEDLAGELALANGTIASQKEYIARLSSAVVQASIEQAQAPAAMRHELELLQSDLACLQNKLSAAMSKLKEQSEGNKLYLKDER